MNSKESLPNSSERIGMQPRTSFYSGIQSKKKYENNPSVCNRTNFKFFNNDIPGAIQSSYESGKLKDTVIKLKRENNKLVQEVSRLKIENQKIEDESKKNLKAVEEILNSHSCFNFDKEDLESGGVPENAVSTLPKIQNVHSLTTEGIVRLREVYVISTLRKQLQTLKGILKEKDLEIQNLKATTKVSTYSKMEGEYNAITNELSEMRRDYNLLKSTYDDRILKYEQLLDENTALKNMFVKYKNHYDEAKNKVHSLEDEKKKLIEAKRTCEEKILYMSKCNQTTKAHKAKEENTDVLYEMKRELNQLQDDNRKIKNEKERLNEKIKLLTKEKTELASKKDQLSEENFSLRTKIDNIKSECEKHKKNIKQANEDKVNKLQVEITNLKKEVELLKSQIAQNSERFIKDQLELQRKEIQLKELEKQGQDPINKEKPIENIQSNQVNQLRQAKNDQLSQTNQIDQVNQNNHASLSISPKIIDPTLQANQDITKQDNHADNANPNDNPQNILDPNQVDKVDNINNLPSKVDHAVIEEEDVMNKSFDEKSHLSKEKENHENEAIDNPTQAVEILRDIEQESIKQFQNNLEEPITQVDNDPINDKDISKLSGISKNLNEKSNNQSILDELNNNEELKPSSSLNEEKRILSIELENSKENTFTGIIQSSSDFNKTPKKRSSIVNEPVSQIIKENLEEEEEHHSVKLGEDNGKPDDNSALLEQEIVVPTLSKERRVSLLETESVKMSRKEMPELSIEPNNIQSDAKVTSNDNREVLTAENANKNESGLEAEE